MVVGIVEHHLIIMWWLEEQSLKKCENMRGMEEMRGIHTRLRFETWAGVKKSESPTDALDPHHHGEI